MTCIGEATDVNEQKDTLIPVGVGVENGTQELTYLGMTMSQQ